jgi:hypothetical protein
MRSGEPIPKYKQPEGWDLGLLPGELTGTSVGIGRCQLHLVGVGFYAVLDFLANVRAAPFRRDVRD